MKSTGINDGGAYPQKERPQLLNGGDELRSRNNIKHVWRNLSDNPTKYDQFVEAGMAAYVGTVLGGLVILMVFYLTLVLLLGKTNPLKFLRGIREVQLLAFSTSSSAAVMPLSMQTAEKQLHVEPSISRFIIPLGATINIDGTALYQVSAAYSSRRCTGFSWTF